MFRSRPLSKAESRPRHRHGLAGRGSSSVTLRLRDLALAGDAVGILDGRAVFVPLGIPGETVRVELLPASKGMLRARLLEVMEPASERVAPPCPYFGLCGGCHWQHIDYSAQLHYKRQMLVSRLQRLGGIPTPPVEPVLAMDDPWGYRNHVQLAVDREGKLGFQGLGTHRVVPVEACAITHPLLDELWAALDAELGTVQRVVLRAGIATAEQMVILEGDSPEVPELVVDMPVSCLYHGPDGRYVVMAGDGHFHEDLAGRIYRISGPSFFQVNTVQAVRLVGLVRDYLDLRPQETLLDAYCGVGTFALSLASQAAHVVGIEISPWAIDDALANRAAGEDAEFIQGDVEQVLSGLAKRFDAALLDPPRAGCSPGVMNALASCCPSRIVYLSCDPATLARDVAYLATHGYALSAAQPVDMFPHTHHLETVALLRRSEVTKP